MSDPRFDPDVYLALKQKGMTNYAIATKLKVDEATVRRGLRKAGFNPNHVPAEMVDDRLLIDTPIVHNIAAQGGLAITADWHHPTTDYGLVNEFIDHCVDLKIKTLAVVGDWFNMDTLSAFDHKQESASLEKEIAYSNVTMERLLGIFDSVYFSWGNHDARFHKVLGYKLSFSQSMRLLFAESAPNMVDKITFSNLDHILVETPEGPDWRLVHPKAYSSVPLTNARKLASKHLTNIATGHSHHTAVGSDVSAEFTCVEIGGFFDASKVDYLRRSTTFPNWQNGYALLDQLGQLKVEGKGWSLGKRN